MIHNPNAMSTPSTATRSTRSSSVVVSTSMTSPQTPCVAADRRRSRVDDFIVHTPLSTQQQSQPQQQQQQQQQQPHHQLPLSERLRMLDGGDSLHDRPFALGSAATTLQRSHRAETPRFATRRPKSEKKSVAQQLRQLDQQQQQQQQRLLRSMPRVGQRGGKRTTDNRHLTNVDENDEFQHDEYEYNNNNNNNNNNDDDDDDYYYEIDDYDRPSYRLGARRAHFVDTSNEGAFHSATTTEEYALRDSVDSRVGRRLLSFRELDPHPPPLLAYAASSSSQQSSTSPMPRTIREQAALLMRRQHAAEIMMLNRANSTDSTNDDDNNHTCVPTRPVAQQRKRNDDDFNQQRQNSEAFVIDINSGVMETMSSRQASPLSDRVPQSRINRPK